MKIITHQNCVDGAASAWLLKTAMSRLAPETAVEVVPSIYFNQNDPAEIDAFDLSPFDGEVVFLTDFSVPHRLFGRLVSAAASVVMLDHHAGVVDHYPDAVTNVSDVAHRVVDVASGRTTEVISVVDASMSGALLVADVFGDYLTHGEIQLAELVSDNDLWTHAIPGSRDLASYFSTVGTDDDTMVHVAANIDEVIAAGGLIRESRDRLVGDLVELSRVVSIDGRSAAAVIAPQSVRSELGNAIVEQHGVEVGLVISPLADGGAKVSVRGAASGGGVREVALRRGGDGHPGAASFYLKPGQVQWFLHEIEFAYE